MAGLGSAGTAAAVEPPEQLERAALNARVAAVRIALALPAAPPQGSSVPHMAESPAQAPAWNNWPKWSKWSNWANA
jgi:hypothetical protein